MRSDIEIAGATRLDIPPHALSPCGRRQAKIDASVPGLAGAAPGRLILAPAMSPTSVGERKTTATIGLRSRHVDIAVAQADLSSVQARLLAVQRV